MLSNTVSGFIFTSLYKISNREHLLVLHVFYFVITLIYFFLSLFTKYANIPKYQQTKQLTIIKNLKNTNTLTH